MAEVEPGNVDSKKEQHLIMPTTFTFFHSEWYIYSHETVQTIWQGWKKWGLLSTRDAVEHKLLEKCRQNICFDDHFTLDSFIIKFGYNACCHWLKERALLVMHAFWLVLTYDLLEDRRIDDVIIETFFPYLLIIYYIKQIDFKLPCVCLTNRFQVAVCLVSNRSQMMSKCGKNKKVALAASCVLYNRTKHSQAFSIC